MSLEIPSLLSHFLVTILPLFFSFSSSLENQSVNWLPQRAFMGGIAYLKYYFILPWLMFWPDVNLMYLLGFLVLPFCESLPFLIPGLYSEGQGWNLWSTKWSAFRRVETCSNCGFILTIWAIVWFEWLWKITFLFLFLTWAQWIRREFIFFFLPLML